MMLKVLLLCVAAISVSTAGRKDSGQEEADYQSPPSPYAFEYNNQDENGTTLFRKESSDGKGRVEGTYGYRDAYGTERFVEYVADENGYRAQIRTNEPGIESRNPAGVQLMVSPHAPRHFSSQEKPFPKKASEASKLKQSFKHQESIGQDSAGQFSSFSSTKKQPQTQQQTFRQPSQTQAPQSIQRQQESQQQFNTFSSTKKQPQSQQQTFSQPSLTQTPQSIQSQQESHQQFNTFSSTKKQPQTQQQAFSHSSQNQTPQFSQRQRNSQQPFNSFPSTQTQPNIQQQSFRPEQTPQFVHEPQDSTAQRPFNTFTSTKKQQPSQQQVFNQPPPPKSNQTPQSAFGQSQTVFDTQSRPPFGNAPFSSSPQTSSAFGKTTETRPAFLQSRPAFVQLQSVPRETSGVTFFRQQPSQNQPQSFQMIQPEPIRGHTFTTHIQHGPEPMPLRAQPIIRTHFA